MTQFQIKVQAPSGGSSPPPHHSFWRISNTSRGAAAAIASKFSSSQSHITTPYALPFFPHTASHLPHCDKHHQRLPAIKPVFRPRSHLLQHPSPSSPQSIHAQHPLSQLLVWILQHHGRQHKLPRFQARWRVAGAALTWYVASLLTSPGAHRTDTTSEQFRILRKKGTEMPGSGEYDKHYPDAGVYKCAGCDAPLYKANHKFDSGCGWPAFWDAVPGAVGQRPDPGLGMMRTEIVCNNCGGHLGHIFKGERFGNPKNERHCVNSVSINFNAEDKK